MLSGMLKSARRQVSYSVIGVFRATGRGCLGIKVLYSWRALQAAKIRNVRSLCCGAKITVGKGV